ncbi:UNVERIFIED_CONTAM: hypothetical protein RMT77_013476 [Armadillidium vulgare]
MTSSCSIDSKPPVCEGCDNTVTKFTLLSESDENLLQFLYNHRVLPKKKICRECENEMWLDENNFLFVCRNKCNSSVSQLKGTIFENSDLSLKIISRFVMLWSQIHPPCPVLLQHELGMSAATVDYWCNKLREVCLHFIMTNSEPIGGVGKIVEIDEAKIDYKIFDGEQEIKGGWIFGGIERQSRKTFLVPVRKKDYATLLPIVKQYIIPGTTVISDCKKNDHCIKFEGYKNLTVKKNFVDPDSGAHTQNIKRLWREVGSCIPKDTIEKNHPFHGYLAEFLFKRKFNNYKQRLHNVWLAIADFYDGSHSNIHSNEMECASQTVIIKSFGDIEKKAVEKKRHRSGKHKKGRKRLRPIDNDQN